MLSFLRDYARILRSGVFMHSAYALRYLGARRLLPFALPYFLLRGETNGDRANPFLDPVLRGADGQRVRLADYLRSDMGRTVRPSADFDPAWYRKRQMAEEAPHPFLHFWRRGFALSLDPAPGFDLAFVTEAVAVFRPDKAEYLFERMAGSGTDFPRNEAELIGRQDAFYAGIALRVLRHAPQPRRRLVFIQAAHDFVPPYRQAGRSFDVMLNVYDGGEPRDRACAETVVVQNGTKTTAIRKLLADAPELLSRYESVLFLDDDIELAGSDVERVFDLFEEHGLDLAQPSLTAASACAYPVLKQPEAGTGVRPVSMVEIMMPLVSRRALLACGEAFAASISGWGVDALLARLVRERFGETVALIADVVAAHERGVDLEGGAFYRYLRAHGIEPDHEIGRIAHRYGTSPMPDAVRLLAEPSAADGRCRRREEPGTPRSAGG